jgi:hypothetical protein
MKGKWGWKLQCALEVPTNLYHIDVVPYDLPHKGRFPDAGERNQFIQKFFVAEALHPHTTSVTLTQFFSGRVKARLNLAIEDTVCHVVILP